MISMKLCPKCKTIQKSGQKCGICGYPMPVDNEDAPKQTCCVIQLHIEQKRG